MCTAPAAWCDVHHVVHWVHGGPTSCENGALLCERHHTAVHEGRFSVARDPGTTVWHTYRPDGTEIHIRATPRDASTTLTRAPDRDAAAAAPAGPRPAPAPGSAQASGLPRSRW